MKFPLDVIKIGNQIILLKGQITKQFILDLRELNNKMYDDEVESFTYIDEYNDESIFEIRTTDRNRLLRSAITIDDRIKQHSYAMSGYTISEDEEDGPIDASIFDIYKGAINHYKNLMGYTDE